MTSSPICPRCGNPLAPSSPAGLCPRCLLAMNLRTRTMPTGEQPSSSPPPAPAELEAKFPQFEILECLGRGGMGVVYKARQKALDRTVAIKILAGEFQDDPGFASRFEKEAKLLARLNHPNIVTIHDFGHAGGLFHIVMEYIDGVNVRDLLRDGRLEPEQALAIVPPICDALQFAHDHGVVHRDIKPENILLDREGRVKIADFGIATIAGEAADRSGTPDYMAPELSGQGSSNAIDHRADIYSLGVVLYEMLTGRRPDKQIEVPSHRVHLDVKIDEIVLRALQGRPELRYQSAGEFKTVVATMASTPTPPPSQQSPPPPPPPAPATPAPQPRPKSEPVPLAARVPATAALAESAITDPQHQARTAILLLLVALVGTPVLLSLVPHTREGGWVVFFGFCCAVASMVFAFMARRTRGGRGVLIVWSSLVFLAALAVGVYSLQQKNVALAAAQRSGQEALAESVQNLNRFEEARWQMMFKPEAERRIQISFEGNSKLEINGCKFSRNEFDGAMRYIAAAHRDLPVRIRSESPRFGGAALVDILSRCRQERLAKVTFCNAPGLDEPSPYRPILIAISESGQVIVDGSPVEDLTLRFKAIAAANPDRNVAITAVSLAANATPEDLRLPFTKGVEVLQRCQEVGLGTGLGFGRLYFTTEAEVARAWANQAQATAEAPTAAGDNRSPGVTVRVRIDTDGSPFLDGRTVSLEELLGELQKFKDRKLTPYVEIEPDPSLPYAKVMPVLEACRLAEVKNVTVVQPVHEEEPPLPMAGTDPSIESVLPQQDPIRITIAADESLKLGGESVTTEELRDKLIAITRESSVTRQVVVSSEAPVRAARIQEVMDVCGQADLKRVSLVKAEDRLREIDLNIALKSYEKLQIQLREARLDRELLNASGTPTNDDLNKAEHLILTLQQQVDEARAAILKLQPEPELQTK